MSQRSRILVDPKVQWSIAGRILCHWALFAVCLVSISAMVRIMSAAGDQPFADAWRSAYRESVRAGRSGSLDERSVRCGFRDFRFEDGYFRLNGRRIFLKCSHTGNHCPVACNCRTIRICSDAICTMSR